MKEQMTLAEAKERGLLPGSPGVKTSKRTTRKAAPRAGATSRCLTHDSEIFTTDAAETRHVEAMGSACRIEAVE
jgi:hypothetical protein